jgi:hypothetical protein
MMGILEITVSSVSGTGYPLRIASTHGAIWSDGYSHLKSWAVEGSDDEISCTEIERREDNSDLSHRKTMKTFAVSPSQNAGKTRLPKLGQVTKAARS